MNRLAESDPLLDPGGFKLIGDLPGLDGIGLDLGLLLPLDQRGLHLREVCRALAEIEEVHGVARSPGRTRWERPAGIRQNFPNMVNFA